MLEQFCEYDHVGINPFKGMIAAGVLPPEAPSLPLMYSIVARKAG